MIRPSLRARPLEYRADAFGFREDIKLLDGNAQMRDTRIFETGSTDAFGKALAQVDVTGGGDSSDRRHDLFIVEHAAAVFSGAAGIFSGSQFDRHANALEL